MPQKFRQTTVIASKIAMATTDPQNPKKLARMSHLYPGSILNAFTGSSQRVLLSRGGRRALTVTTLNARRTTLMKATVRTVHAKPIFGIRRDNTIGKMTPVPQLNQNSGGNRQKRRGRGIFTSECGPCSDDARCGCSPLEKPLTHHCVTPCSGKMSQVAVNRDPPVMLGL
jgi:hypothetical protein